MSGRARARRGCGDDAAASACDQNGVWAAENGAGGTVPMTITQVGADVTIDVDGGDIYYGTISGNTLVATGNFGSRTETLIGTINSNRD